MRKHMKKTWKEDGNLSLNVSMLNSLSYLREDSVEGGARCP